MTTNSAAPSSGRSVGKLSQERAAAVKSYLVEHSGVAADRMTTAGFGGTKPVADNATDDGRAQNRRVELVKK